MKPLKWHNFLIYFGLWADALILVLGAVSVFRGAQYGNMADRIYEAFPAMRLLDSAYGLVMIAIAAYQIYTRFQLAGFKKGAPQKLLSLYVIVAAWEVLYTVLFVMVTGISLTEPDNAENILSRLAGRLIGAAIIFFINKVYYGKRAELFVN